MRKKHILISVIIISILIIGIIGIVFIKTSNSNGNEIDPIIIIETEECYVGEEIQLRVDQVKSGSNISWIIDENTTNYGEKTSIVYDTSDNHEVICNESATLMIMER